MSDSGAQPTAFLAQLEALRQKALREAGAYDSSAAMIRLFGPIPVYERHFGEAVCKFMVRHGVKTAADIGHGTGTSVGAALAAGCDVVLGIDINPHEREIIFDKNLLQYCVLADALTYEFSRTYDCVTCTEMAEHVAEEDAEQLCKQIGRACGRLLYFTAAPPEQPGPGHVNCQPQEYWRDLLGKEGLVFDADETKVTRAEMLKEFEPCEKYLAYLARNIQIFRREGDG